MPRLSSDYECLPNVCERCGAPAQLIADPSSRVAAAAMYCRACNHGWFIPVENPPPIFKRKADRRRDVTAD